MTCTTKLMRWIWSCPGGDVCVGMEISPIQRNFCGIVAALMIVSERDLHATFLLCAHHQVSCHCAVLPSAFGVLCAYRRLMSFLSCSGLRWEDLGCQCRRDLK